jgi:hypothetical protein
MHIICCLFGARMNKHLPVHHPMDAHYDSFLDETQLS